MPSRVGMRAAATIVALLAMAVYANTLRNGFALDDKFIIVNNERVHGIERIPEAVSTPYWPGVLEETGLYRPLTVASYAVEWEVWGDDPLGYHAINVALHGAVTALVFTLLVTLEVSSGIALAAAAIFAVHPVHTEAVANVVGRAELLAAFFFLTGCLLYLRSATPRWLYAAGIGACYFFSMASKEIGVTLPAVLMLLEAAGWRTNTGEQSIAARLRGQLRVWIAVAFAGVSYAAARLGSLGVVIGNDTAPGLVELSPVERLLTAARVWPEYARLLAFPRELVIDYSPGVITHPEGIGPFVALGFGLCAAVVLIGAAAWRRDRLLSLALAWFAITIFPVSNLVVAIGVMLAERTLYLPSVAVPLMVAAGAAHAPKLRPAFRNLLAAGFVVLLLLGAIRTWHRNPVWRSTNAAIASLVREHPESFRSQWAVGHSLIEHGRIDEGLRHYRAALHFAPNHFALLVEYGVQLMRVGRDAQADPLFRRALEISPNSGNVYVLEGQSLLNQVRPADAIQVLTTGARHAPTAGIYQLLSTAQSELGHLDAAVAAQRKSIARAGDRAAWSQWQALAELERRRGRADAATRALAHARSLRPAGSGPTEPDTLAAALPDPVP